MVILASTGQAHLLFKDKYAQEVNYNWKLDNWMGWLNEGSLHSEQEEVVEWGTLGTNLSCTPECFESVKFSFLP